MKDIYTVILAAGKGTRYKGKTTKLLEDLAGLPIISHIHRIANGISGKNVIIVCNKDNVKEFKKIINNCIFVIQKKQKGTADAILSAKPYLKNKNFLILFGDVPLISKESINKLLNNFKNNKNSGSMIAFKSNNPFGYGRVKKFKNKVIKVVEEINANKYEKQINLCNSGVMIVQSKSFFDNLNKIKVNLIKKEKYLPDIFEIYSNQKKPLIFSPSSFSYYNPFLYTVDTKANLIKPKHVYKQYM